MPCDQHPLSSLSCAEAGEAFTPPCNCTGQWEWRVTCRRDPCPAVPGGQPGPAPPCSAPHEAPPTPNSQRRQSKAVNRQQSTRAVSTAAHSPACEPHAAYRMGTNPLSPINPFLAISTVKCLVIFSSSCSCARTTKHTCYYRPQEKSQSRGTASGSCPALPVQGTP